MAAVAVEDDIYAGYNDYSSVYDIKDLEQDELFQEVIRTSYGKRSVFTPKTPGTAMRLGTSSRFQRSGTTTSMQPMTAGLRPMTAVRSAGYTSSNRQTFDPLNMGSSTKVATPALEINKEDTPEEKIRATERKIMGLIESSAEAASEKNVRIALERAREASSRERALIRLQEQAGLSDNHNIDLTFAVLFNLAVQYTNNEMYTEAIATYQAITRNKMFNTPNNANSANRLKVNMANIYVKMGQLSQAIKMYRMAFDQTTTAHKDLRYNQLLGIIPSDPGVLQKLGEMYDQIGDKQQAFQFYSDSYRFYPANFDVIDWLGSYFISMQVAEKALSYFKKAVELVPDEPRWRLLVAACLRRTGQFQKALVEYQDIYNKFPDNIECLKFLVRLCSDLGLKEAQMYAAELKKAEKAKELKDRQGSGRPGTTGSRKSNSGTSSRAGSGLSVLSDHRPSPDRRPISGRNDYQQGTNYADPIGPLPTRPMTAAGKRDDDFGDEELGDDLLPE